MIVQQTVHQWELVWRLGVALALSTAIGIERDIRQKSAGLRTYTLVGLGSALFMLISQYGFFDVLRAGTVVLDPSRVAAGIVAGIGFIGAGLIFVDRGSVRGLTTAAGIWLTGAIGAACGASLVALATAPTVGYFLVVLVVSPLAARLPALGYPVAALRLTYLDRRGILRRVLELCTAAGFKVAGIDVSRSSDHPDAVVVLLEVHGRQSTSRLAADLNEIEGVLNIAAGEADELSE
jgi:putative Mg2+ transporter-C (MgtC) family protein